MARCSRLANRFLPEVGKSKYLLRITKRVKESAGKLIARQKEKAEEDYTLEKTGSITLYII